MTQPSIKLFSLPGLTAEQATQLLLFLLFFIFNGFLGDLYLAAVCTVVIDLHRIFRMDR